jgi:hypothetical protein
MGLTVRGSNTAKNKRYFLRNVHMGAGPHPASYQQVPGFLRKEKRPEREVTRPLASNAEVKVDRNYRPTSAPPVCQHGVDKGSFAVIMSY